MITLTDEQQMFIDMALAGKNILVDACIGSGKTTTIQKACEVLSPKKVLYLTYNRRLYDDACKKIHDSNTTIATFHRFAAQCCAGNGIAQTSMNTVCRQFANISHIPKYDVVIVDEYQDLREDTAGVLNAICRISYLEYNGFVPQFLIVGDMQQKIYDTSNFKADAFIQYLFGVIKNDEYMRFTKCFRLAPTYAAEIGQAWGKSIIGCNPNNRVETIDSLRHVANILSMYEPKDILVLGGKMSWGARTQLQNMLEEMHPNKFNKNTVYASMDEQDEMQSFDTSDAAIFTTYDSAKGLERKVCVVCDFTDKYLEARQKHSVSRQILKNIFLVAASRGKERIIFYTDNRYSDKLSFAKIGAITGDMPIDMKPVAMSNAFEHKYEEDIRDCVDFLNITKIQDAGETIQATKSDGFIDLSACIGIHAQATYFENFDIDSIILRNKMDALNRGIKLPEFNPTWSLQKKILYYISMESGQLRYLRDIKKKFVSRAADKAIHSRLATVFDGTESVELPCRITFQNAKNAVTGARIGDKTLTGRCDVFTHDGELYELKFVDTVTPDHELQAALYAIAFDVEYAVIWNLQDDTKYRVSIDPAKISDFLQCVCKCISKDMLTVDAGNIHISG